MGKRRIWTASEKLDILKEADSGDITLTCRKHGLSTATFYNWKKKFESRGEKGLKVKYDSRDPELKRVEEENRILRKLLSDKDIELEVQRELLKKKFGTSDPRKI